MLVVLPVRLRFSLSLDFAKTAISGALRLKTHSCGKAAGSGEHLRFACCGRQGRVTRDILYPSKGSYDPTVVIQLTKRMADLLLGTPL